MNASRIARLEAMFHAALEMTVDARGAYLAAEPDATLRESVERLLAHHAIGDAPLDAALQSAIDGAAASWRPRERIGAYRLLRELGAGGMGTVFLAEREL